MFVNSYWYNSRISGYIKGIQQFSRKAAKVYDVMFFGMQNYIYTKTVLKTLYTEVKHKS